jgi:uncharacterized membrane protein required for colicin V production
VAILIGFGVFFFLGFLQGTIRRLLDIGATTAAFVIAANLREPVGGFFADNWRQFNADYNQLIAFVIVFVALLAIATILIQVTYKRVVLSVRYPVLEEIAGGVIGVLEAFVLLLYVVIIFNSYKLPDAQPGDLGQFRDLQNAVVGQSHIANWVREAVAPGFVHVVGILLPANLVKLFP